MKHPLHSGARVYRRPAELGQALEVLAAHRPAVLAGGTDYYPAHVDRPIDAALLDLSGIASLRGVTREAAHWRIGALTTWTDLARGALPPALAALREASVEIGGPQVQNRGTIGGNLCNASPAADGVPVLLALGAGVELASRRGSRELPLEAFVLGPRRTALADDELLVAIRVPAGGPSARSRFLKLGHRRYLVISIAMVAVAIDLDAQERTVSVGIAVGACSAVAQRLPELEARLLGAPLGTLAGAAARALEVSAGSLLAPLTPIDDVRGSARYRLDAVATLVPRVFQDLAA
jgi:CO/xanthine dehydrogenase FAD-binding subunit